MDSQIPNRNFLPSKKFVSRVIILVLVLLVGLLTSKVSPEVLNTVNKNKELKGLSVRDLIQNDANKNGIADWEESLFGLDPKGDGEENKKIILEKKKELGTDVNKNNKSDLSQNDRLSRELFSIITSLDQTGNLNEASIENIASALDKKLSSDPISDTYQKSMLTTKPTSTSVVEAYYNAFGEIAIKYGDSEIGKELTYISQGLVGEDKKAMEIARNIADEYENFSKDLIDIKNIPSSIVDTHLALANSYHKTGVAIERMSIMLDDPLFGMNAVVDYKNFSDDIITSLEDVGNFFEKSVIIN